MLFRSIPVCVCVCVWSAAFNLICGIESMALWAWGCLESGDKYCMERTSMIGKGMLVNPHISVTFLKLVDEAMSSRNRMYQT